MKIVIDEPISRARLHGVPDLVCAFVVPIGLVGFRFYGRCASRSAAQLPPRSNSRPATNRASSSGGRHGWNFDSSPRARPAPMALGDHFKTGHKGSKTMLERKDLQTRLVNGSDYPLPAVNVVIRTSALVESQDVV